MPFRYAGVACPTAGVAYLTASVAYPTAGVSGACQPALLGLTSLLVVLQGRAAHIRSKHQQHGGAPEGVTERPQTPPKDTSGTSGGGASDQGAEPAAGENGEEASVKLITSAHVRSAMMMANLIEGRDNLEDEETIRGGTTVVRPLLGGGATVVRPSLPGGMDDSGEPAQPLFLGLIPSLMIEILRYFKLSITSAPRPLCVHSPLPLCVHSGESPARRAGRKLWFSYAAAARGADGRRARADGIAGYAQHLSLRLLTYLSEGADIMAIHLGARQPA